MDEFGMGSSSEGSAHHVAALARRPIVFVFIDFFLNPYELRSPFSG